jgi:hypothetical protein
MSFNNRTEFKLAQASEKITLAHVQAKKRLVIWQNEGGDIYSKFVPYFVVGIALGSQNLVSVNNVGNLVAGTFYYSPEEGKVYIFNPASENPDENEIIVTYRLFFANSTLDQTWNFDPAEKQVLYQGRIISAPEYKHKIGIDQNLVSLVGKGNLVLQNNDGYFEDIYDSLIFENQTISIYSWNRQLPFDDVDLIFEGKVTDKKYTSEKVTFIVKDSIFDFAQNVPQRVYDNNDNVNDSIKGRYKRWVYGRVDGLRAQSIDQIGEGYEIAGTVNSVVGRKELTKFSNFPGSSGSDYIDNYFLMSTAKNDENIMYWYGTTSLGTQPPLPPGYTETRKIIIALGDSIQDVISKTKAALDFKFNIIDIDLNSFYVENEELGESTDGADGNTGITIEKIRDGITAEKVEGTGTSFLSDVSPGDRVNIGTQEFTIDQVFSDTELWLSSVPAFGFSNAKINLNPEIPTTVKNREYFVADHECTELIKTVVNVPQLNRVILSDTENLEPGDFLKFATGQQVEIRSIGLNNNVTLRQNLSQPVAIGSNCTRPPIQEVYIRGQRVASSDFTINNNNELTVTLSKDTEFNLASLNAISDSLTFTNGSRVITSSSTTNLEDILKPRDWIRPSLGEFTTFYEILEVKQNEIILRTTYTDPTVTTSGTYKSPEYIDDNTIVSADVLGRTEDGTKSGVWIKNAPQVMLDLLNSINIQKINTQSFIDGQVDNPQTISMALPFSPGDSGISVKKAVDELSNTVLASLTLDNDLNIKYNALSAAVPDDIQTIKDTDLVSWNIRSVNGKLYKTAIVKYRNQDIVRSSLEAGAETVTFSSDFVQNYIGTEKVNEINVRLYNELDANIRARREVYYNRLAKTEVTIESDLRLEDYEIGDRVQLDIRRLFKRLGDNLTAKKIMTITGKEVNGAKVVLVLSDYGNIFNTSSVITPNSANPYNVATSEEKIKYGYITNNQGVVDSDEDTVNTNLIS